MSKMNAIIMKPQDNVATVTENIGVGVDVFAKVDGKILTTRVTDTILFGHKVAILNINVGEKIIKYGEVIGKATTSIAAGQHVHVHNLEGCRGRGDLES